MKRDDTWEDLYDEIPPRRRVYRCGGWAAWSGPCGATDCEDCYPGGERREGDSEEESDDA